MLHQKFPNNQLIGRLHIMMLSVERNEKLNYFVPPSRQGTTLVAESTMPYYTTV
jgi:hypothetical protein